MLEWANLKNNYTRVFLVATSMLSIVMVKLLIKLNFLMYLCNLKKFVIILTYLIIWSLDPHFWMESIWWPQAKNLKF